MIVKHRPEKRIKGAHPINFFQQQGQKSTRKDQMERQGQGQTDSAIQWCRAAVVQVLSRPRLNQWKPQRSSSAKAAAQQPAQEWRGWTPLRASEQSQAIGGHGCGCQLGVSEDPWGWYSRPQRSLCVCVFLCFFAHTPFLSKGLCRPTSEFDGSDELPGHPRTNCSELMQQKF